MRVCKSHPHLFNPSIQLIIRFLGLRFPYTLTCGFLLPLLLGLESKWILAWHILSFSAKIKQNFQTLHF